MNITPMQMYWITKLTEIKELFGFISILLIVIAICDMMYGGIQDAFTVAKKLYKWTVSVIVISCIVYTFTPSTKQMAAILIVPRIANSEKVEKIGNGLYDLAVEWMNEFKPIKKEGAK